MTREPNIVIRYQTSDAEVFEKKMDAWNHEKKLSKRDLANEMLAEGCTVGAILRKLGHHCIDPILDKITKDSKMCIEYFQCSTKPGYQVKNFAINMSVYVHGDAGAWSGEYGNWITLETLVRYAQHRSTIL